MAEQNVQRQNVEIQADSSDASANQNSKTNPENAPNFKNLDPTHPSSPFFIGNNDGNGGILVTQILEASNYHAWARSVKRALRIKNKLGFIDGTICEPADQDDHLMEHWLRCNDVVITWLQNSMAMEIRSSTVYVETAHQLWLELEQRFGQHNVPRVYEVKQAIMVLIQSQDDVSAYYSKFKTLIDELQNYETIPNCPCGALKIVVNNQQRDCVMKFLMGLNESYKDINAQILLMKPFPTLNEVYATVQ